MARKKSKKMAPAPLYSIGGPDELEACYPDEMKRLGTLTAYWSIVETSLCRVLCSLLGDIDKAEAAFYSTINHKARRDMVFAVSKHSSLAKGVAEHIEVALVACKDAADARNNLLHGLFKIEPHSGELLTEHRRPVARVPKFTKNNVAQEIDATISKCCRASELLMSAAIRVDFPGLMADIDKAIEEAFNPERDKQP